MRFVLNHSNINVLNLEKSLQFYREALGLVEIRRKEAEDGSFKLVFLGDGISDYFIELTWLRERDKPYDLGDNESHLAFVVDDFDAAHQLHDKMGCICFENKKMGFISSMTPTITGWRLFRKRHTRDKEVDGEDYS